jgi:hypothetical protein
VGVTPRQHALYRFFASDGSLLYIGITADPGARWKQHAGDKPWWSTVANITVEAFPSREAVLEAERAAILAERPRHNVVHNRGTDTGRTIETPQLDRLAPFQPGDWAALGLQDGRCLVGEIEALDSTWVSLRLKNFLTGGLTETIVAVRWVEVGRAELAYPEDAEEGGGVFGAGRCMQDEHLGEFQTAWQRVHLGSERDPVDQARLDYRREKQEMENARERRRISKYETRATT